MLPGSEHVEMGVMLWLYWGMEGQIWGRKDMRNWFYWEVRVVRDDGGVTWEKGGCEGEEGSASAEKPLGLLAQAASHQ